LICNPSVVLLALEVIALAVELDAAALFVTLLLSLAVMQST
jgi:hypothetical protein